MITKLIQSIKVDNLFWIGVSSVLVLHLLEIVSYPNFIYNRIGISLFSLSFISIIALFIYIFKHRISHITQAIVAFLSLAIVIVTSALHYWESTTFPNAVFSTFHLNLPSLLELSLFCIAVYSVLLVAFIQRDYKRTISQIPLIFFTYITLLFFCNPIAFEVIGSEDSFIEWFTTTAFIISGIALIFSVNKNLAQNKVKNLLLVMIGIACLIIGGEEISWGQRIFSPEIPEYFQENNVQNEITLHNISGVHDLVFIMYAVAGLIAVAAPHIKKYLPESLRFLVPKKYITLYFVALTVYGIYRMIAGPVYYKTWEESVEIIFSAGILIYSLEMLASQKNISFKITDVKTTT